MNPVVHFEMTAEDRKRMADFYTKVFGWKIQQLGEETGVLVTTIETSRPEMRADFTKEVCDNHVELVRYIDS